MQAHPCAAATPAFAVAVRKFRTLRPERVDGDPGVAAASGRLFGGRGGRAGSDVFRQQMHPPAFDLERIASPVCYYIVNAPGIFHFDLATVADASGAPRSSALILTLRSFARAGHERLRIRWHEAKTPAPPDPTVGFLQVVLDRLTVMRLFCARRKWAPLVEI